MAYTDTNGDILNDIVQRKEFYSLKNKHKYSAPIDIIPSFVTDEELKRGNHLQFHSYQKFVQNYINPDTPYKRLLMKHSTGSGKTIGAIGIAMNYIKYYRQEETIGTSKEMIGSVYVIAFDGAKKAFQKDLLRFPQFGFATRKELLTWNELKYRAQSNIQSDIDKAYEYGLKIKKRISNRKGNGFFKFIGYKALVNRLFDSEETISDLSEDEIIKQFYSGKLSYNKNVLNTFKNSLIICDEIHNVYNSLHKNNWGIVLQIILDSDPSIRAVFMSATPINNNPSEVIDLLNLLVDKNKRLKREDYFNKKQLKHGALEKLKSVSQGLVSYLIDKNPIYYPSRSFTGDEIKSIKYLKFNRCVLSGKHLQTYKHALNNKLLAQDSRYIMDFILPNPNTKDDMGLYKSSDLRKIHLAGEAWKSKHNIEINKNIISGEFLNISNLKNVSNKYYSMMNDIISLIKKNDGKLFIYHNYVNMSGVVFIKEILLRNGIIDENMGSVNNTLCSICGNPKSTHDSNIEETKNDKNGHIYKPVRFIIVHSELDNVTAEKSIDKYNRKSNSMGHDFKILIGSRKIKESYDLKAIRHMMIMSRPDNIPTLIQILGRAVRNGSHTALPKNMSHVYVHIYTHSLPNGDLTYEEMGYKEKIHDYEIIQLLEKKLFHESAVDAIINYETVKSGLRENDLGDLGFTPDLKNKSFNLSQLNLKTFNIYHGQDEVDLTTYIIKRAFMETSTVWKYSDLMKYIRSPNFSVEYDTSIISEQNIVIALSKLLWTQQTDIENVYIEDKNTNIAIVDKIFDPMDKRFILSNRSIGAITQIGDYYMLLPLEDGVLRKHIDMVYRSHIEYDHSYVDIKKYLKQTSNKFNYNTKKHNFKIKYENNQIEQLSEAVCDYGVDFHVMFIEECISYIFNSWTDWSTDKSDFHDFYFKMLYYYDIIGLVIFADSVKEFIFKQYETYLLPSKFMEKRKKEMEDAQYNSKQISEERTKINLLNLISRNISKSSCTWCPQVTKEIYTRSLGDSLERFSLIKKSTSTKIVKIKPNLLPIGHFLQKYPKFYHPNKGWFSSPGYLVNKTKWVENPIIIGYNVKSKTGIHVRFKLRTPVQNIEIHEDARLIEKGSTCSHRSKHFLLELSKKLNIKVDNKSSITVLCNEIKARLMYLELIERSKGTNIKFFYSHFEINAD